MKVEISVSKEKASAMPAGALDALRDEMTVRLAGRYSDVEVIVKKSSNDGLSVTRSQDKEGDREYVQEVLQEAWETADEWFTK